MKSVTGTLIARHDLAKVAACFELESFIWIYWPLMPLCEPIKMDYSYLLMADYGNVYDLTLVVNS